MIYCRNALRELLSSFPDFHHFFFVVSENEKDEEAPVGTGGSCGVSLGVYGTPSRIGDGNTLK
jgi:hypothetical protein